MTYTDPQYDQTIEDTQDAPPPSGGRSAWHGRTASDAQGNRIMWVEPVNGRGGSWRRMSEATATQQAREAVATERARLGTFERASPLAEQFIGLNARTPTGGWVANSFNRERQAAENPEDSNIWHGLNYPLNWVGQEPARMQAGRPRAVLPAGRSDLDTMFFLQSQALRGNIPAGGAQTANSAFEQQVLRGLFPTLGGTGDANLTNAAMLLTNRDIQRRRVDEIGVWLQSHPDLSGFDEHFAAIETPLRAQAMPQYRQRLLRLSWEAASDPGLASGNAQVRRRTAQTGPATTPPRPPGVPQTARWNPQSRTWEE